ncbi:ABC transporter substrate-binding protein [Xinfangfangia pollutisoli]|uniref:ABC transporter substrate-binding protein n=1 Tax=Xinfangfangia pollutisoli TaxID=2865960 RepID=UPI001CD78D54|nr:ABC transporter substrate-binding protein [Xinfangfangia pollutisoli]
MSRLALSGTTALILLASSGVSLAQEVLRISSWGGGWRDLIAETIAAKFTENTGAEVEFITGGTIDRLNQAQLAAGAPESDVTFTTAHVGWLYQNSGLFEPLDMSRLSNADKLFDQAKISPGHVGVWSYVYTIVYVPDLVPDVRFDSWADLWSPALAGKIGLSDFDPSSIIAATAKMEGLGIEDWRQATDKLKALKPNVRAYFPSDAASEQLISTGETPVQVMLSMMAHQLRDQGIDLEIVIPKEGAVLNMDAIGIMKGTDKLDLAYAFIDAALDPEVQAKIVAIKKGGATVEGVEVPPEVAALPGVFLTPEQWQSEAIYVDPQLRAEKLTEWRTWFSEEMIAN